MFRKLATMALLSTLTISAQAELVEFDWQQADDNMITVDTSTGKLWLDLSVTRGMSISQVKSMVETDGEYTNWRLPTVTEMQALAGNIFPVTQDSPTSEYTGHTMTDSEKATHSLLGYTIGDFVYGVYEDFGNTHLFGTGPNGLYMNYRRANGNTKGYAYDGVYLVSDSTSASIDHQLIDAQYNLTSVSAPAMSYATGLLCALGLLAHHRRRRRTR